MQKNQTFLLIAVITIYGVLISSIGFLSDDFDLLHRAQNQHIFQPLEEHHYSLLVNGLFQIAPQWIPHPQVFHLSAILFHAINVFLVMHFCTKFLKQPPVITLPITLLFAINLPGIEALAWCCALPYVINATLTLVLMITYCHYLDSPNNTKPWLVSALLSTIFLIGAITWEWIVLVIPILLTFSLLYESKKTYQQKITPIIPLVAILITVLFARTVVGLSPGYPINSPIQMVGIMISSPFIGFFPFLPKEFYSSSVGVASEILLFTLMLWGAAKHSQLKILLIIFLICQIPSSILGHPQSRYFYFSTFPLYAFGILIIYNTEKYRLLFSSWYVACLFLSIQKFHSWQQASTLATQTKQNIHSLIDKNDSPIAILDLPKAYGPEETIWRPHLWRCGFEIFNGHVITDEEASFEARSIYIPTYRFTWKDPYTSFEFKEVDS